MNEVLISIATDFSKTPAGRFSTDGPSSGEAFRKRLLEPSLRKNARIVVDLNNTLGFGSSFLEEAFGGLVRDGFSARELHEKLEVKTNLQTYKNRIWQYINEADLRSKQS